MPETTSSLPESEPTETQAIAYGCPCGAMWPTESGGACSPTCPRPPLFKVRVCTVCRGPLSADDEGPECDSYGCPARGRRRAGQSSELPMTTRVRDAAIEAAAEVLRYGQDVQDEQDADYWRYKAGGAIDAFLAAEGFEVERQRQGRIPYSDTAPRPPMQQRLVSAWRPSTARISR